MKMIFETERLIIRQFSTQDAHFIMRLLNTEGWLQFIGDRGVHSTDAALQYINKLNNFYSENGFGFWAVEIKSTKNCIGLCGLLKRDELELADIGFAFLPHYCGNGYAFEAANATLNYAKTELLMSSICAITLANNFSSIKLIKKLGLHFHQVIIMDNEELNYYC
jgi:RimJ/RimL family protein N-acetyltransferase